VKDFYNAFFADDLDYSEIELQNNLSDDTDATRIFNTIKQLMEEIVEKLKSENQ